MGAGCRVSNPENRTKTATSNALTESFGTRCWMPASSDRYRRFVKSCPNGCSSIIRNAHLNSPYFQTVPLPGNLTKIQRSLRGNAHLPRKVGGVRFKNAMTVCLAHSFTPPRGGNPPGGKRFSSVQPLVPKTHEQPLRLG
jgi:hypothetical protein